MTSIESNVLYINIYIKQEKWNKLHVWKVRYSVPSSLDRIYSDGRRALILENCIGLPDRILDVGDAG